MARTVEINEDILINACWDRIEGFRQAESFGDEFWNGVFDYFSDIGWFKPQYNSPEYIIDNIVYNGEICHKDDCADNYYAINEEYDGDVEAWAEDNDYPIFGDFVVINFGL